MIDEQVLDLTGFLPQRIKIKMGEQEIVISSDQPPALIARLAHWMESYYIGLRDLEKPVDIEEGWRIAEEICGRDMREIGTLGLVRLGSFFQQHTVDKLREMSSMSPLELLENSMEQSNLETSLEADSSSPQPLTS